MWKISPKAYKEPKKNWKHFPRLKIQLTWCQGLPGTLLCFWQLFRERRSQLQRPGVSISGQFWRGRRQRVGRVAVHAIQQRVLARNGKIRVVDGIVQLIWVIWYVKSAHCNFRFDLFLIYFREFFENACLSIFSGSYHK